ncbi:MAG: lipid-A-disaccharide synthase [Candidatus Solibacter sp.]|nr:lipid-A-disaccharide synthase [Candidatus Solibacter sp.]
MPALLLYFLLRGFGNRKYWHSVPERFGFLPRHFRQIGPGAIWLHAVSMGEILACVEFARRLKTEFPRSRLFVSTSTLAGRATAEQKLGAITDGIWFAPVDYVWVLRRVLRALKPSLVIVAETEIWPNLFREVHRIGAGLAIVNGRISDKALPKYLRMRWVFPVVLAAVDRILAQTEEMAERFRQLGAERVRVGGNLKFDFEARAAGPESPVVQLLERVRPGKVWIAASTMTDEGIDEDDAVIAAWRELRRRDVFLILVPRKPERFDAAAAKLDAAGVRYVRRSRLEPGGALPEALLLDSIGELGTLFAYADVVLMGGTLAARGGHNILEPALFGKPVIVGPHMENFQAIADEFRAARAIAEIGAAEDLAGAVDRVLASDDGIGERARTCAEARRGATALAIAEMREVYRLPRHRPAMPWFALAWALSRVWRWEARRRQVRDYAKRKRLKAPVISVGNLTMGGTGKTPCVLRLAELLRADGRKPGILTRGYGRTSPVNHMALAAGATVRPEESGDEPQIFLRSRVAPVGIGADRFQTGSLLAERFGTDVIVLDDGFQHVKLARDFDIVLIDALNPFGGCEVFPVGRLREPLQGLARADAVVITRNEASDMGPAIERAICRWNPTVPILRARIEPEWWVEHRTGRHYRAQEFRLEKAGVFCGLGNPLTFYRTLEGLGLKWIDSVEFEDHHRYRAKELERIASQFQARGATALVTTEKDAINLCEGADELVAPLQLYWLKVGMRIEGEAELMERIEKSLARRG